MNSNEIIQKAVEVLKIEADGITNLARRIDENFSEMVELICDSSGRLIIGGIGKSGIVGRKIVATLNSTGTRSLFLHPVEAMHGDLGQVSAGDIFIALSKSGETDELNILLPSMRRIGCKIIAFTGNKNSTLANHSDIVIDVGVEREACPLGLAPTASTTSAWETAMFARYVPCIPSMPRLRVCSPGKPPRPIRVMVTGIRRCSANRFSSDAALERMMPPPV